ncbi:hypothetical protein FPQ18DRAFT_271318, partial [Pyronema domesticum]|uniref:Similar to 26S proteasome regulatory subunit rpn10 acc. no. O94444 n=1 Tax=Pyronema omphalodes (strain CBS 100304) TaxID=1076935 RepID=U4LRF6_PYROM
MVLEATMIVVDNSESSRNGDYLPTRFEAQADAVSLLYSAKTQANPESSVGLMTMGGKGPEVLVTLTTDYGKILTGLHDTKIKGEAHLATGIQVAGLALKHRQNKQQRQRIIVFVGSPIAEDEKTLVKLAKKMKKNNVAVDFVNFGEVESDNTQKLQAFIEAVNSNDNSHMVTIPPGPQLLSDRLLATPILGETGSSESGAAGADGGTAGEGSSGFEFGFDPNLDPELAMALRMSMEDEKARVAKAEKEKEEAEKKAAGEGSSNLDSVKEEDENTPLLKDDKKDKKDDDKMDIA